jgi:hypothetical protein
MCFSIFTRISPNVARSMTHRRERSKRLERPRHQDRSLSVVSNSLLTRSVTNEPNPREPPKPARVRSNKTRDSRSYASVVICRTDTSKVRGQSLVLISLSGADRAYTHSSQRVHEQCTSGLSNLEAEPHQDRMRDCGSYLAFNRNQIFYRTASVIAVIAHSTSGSLLESYRTHVDE